jgi:hypothetical protein
VGSQVHPGDLFEPCLWIFLWLVVVCMNELLRFLKTNEVWIYVLLGLVGLWYLRKLLVALAEWRGALFGLEKDNAQRQLSAAMSVLILLALMGASEFLLVSFISPTFPGIDLLPTPTLDLLATPTVTLSPALLSSEVGKPTENQSTPTLSLTPVVTQTLAKSGCIPGQLEFIYPDKPGTELKGAVTLKGTVSVADFGYYKYEFAPPGSNNWTPIAAGQNVVNASTGNELGPPWETSQMTPGDYLLRLVVTDHEGKSLPECEIQIRVSAP